MKVGLITPHAPERRDVLLVFDREEVRDWLDVQPTPHLISPCEVLICSKLKTFVFQHVLSYK